MLLFTNSNRFSNSFTIEMDFPEDLDHVFEEYLEDDSEGIFDYANLDVNYDIESLKDIDDPLQDPMGDEDVPSTSKAKSSKKVRK